MILPLGQFPANQLPLPFTTRPTNGYVALRVDNVLGPEDIRGMLVSWIPQKEDAKLVSRSPLSEIEAAPLIPQVGPIRVKKEQVASGYRGDKMFYASFGSLGP